MKTLTNYLPFAVLGLVLAAVFYWFQVRPADIRSACSNQTTDKLKDVRGLSVGDWQKAYDLGYKSCLNKHGL